MSRAKAVWMFVGEHVLLAMALALTVPPYASEKGEAGSYVPAGVIVALCAAGSRGFAWAMNRETWLGLIIKTVAVVGAGLMMHWRVR